MVFCQGPLFEVGALDSALFLVELAMTCSREFGCFYTSEITVVMHSSRRKSANDMRVVYVTFNSG